MEELDVRTLLEEDVALRVGPMVLLLTVWRVFKAGHLKFQLIEELIQFIPNCQRSTCGTLHSTSIIGIHHDEPPSSTSPTAHRLIIPLLCILPFPPGCQTRSVPPRIAIARLTNRCKGKSGKSKGGREIRESSPRTTRYVHSSPLCASFVSLRAGLTDGLETELDAEVRQCEAAPGLV